jgi:hypothetical protein
MNIKNENRHTGCYYCGSGGFLFTDYNASGDSISAGMKLSEKHEGWPGIPHGGIGITAIYELIDIMDGSGAAYPSESTFRFGGESISTGDEITITVTKNETHYIGRVVSKNDRHPYLSAVIGRNMTDVSRQKLKMFTHPDPGVSRKTIGIKLINMAGRIIFSPGYQEDNDLKKIECMEAGGNPDFYHCTICSNTESGTNGINAIGDILHPGAIATILDEMLGWTIFHASNLAGVTTNLHCSMLTPVSRFDSLYVDTIYEGMKGSQLRKFASCSGGLFVKRGDRSDLAAFASGRWFMMPDLDGTRHDLSDNHS